jgi:hypothetical protein
MFSTKEGRQCAARWILFELIHKINHPMEFTKKPCAICAVIDKRIGLLPTFNI